jgi:hypothetical protein
VRAWNLVEARTAELVPNSSNPTSTRMHLKMLSGLRIISSDLYQLGRQLSDLRNRVVHGDVMPTKDDAKEFVNAAWRLTSELSRADPVQP